LICTPSTTPAQRVRKLAADADGAHLVGRHADPVEVAAEPAAVAERARRAGLPDVVGREVRVVVVGVVDALHDGDAPVAVEAVQRLERRVEAHGPVVGPLVERQQRRRGEADRRPHLVVDGAPRAGARDDGVEPVVAAAEVEDDEPTPPAACGPADANAPPSIGENA
jgi:hypothetical protein